jgi:hypothetical protein
MYTGCQEMFVRNLQDIPISIFDVSKFNVQLAGLTVNITSGMAALRMCQQGNTLVQAAGSLGFDTSNTNATNLITQQINNLNVSGIIDTLGLKYARQY